MKKLVALITVAALVGIAFGYTAGSSEEQSSEIQIRYLTTQVGSEPSSATIEALVQEWNDSNDGTAEVTIEGVPNFGNYLSKLKTDIAAGTTPDVFYYNDVLSRPFWGSDAVGDITPYVTDAMKESASESDWRDCSVDGRILGFPYVKMTTSLFYRKDIFDEVGVEAPLETWSDFFEACELIKSAGYAPFAGMTGDNNAWTTMNIFSAYVGSIGGPQVLDNLTDYSDPAWMDGAKFLAKLGNYVTDDAIGAQYPIAANNFLQGNAAMIANGPWMVPQFKETPGLYDKVGLMPYPGADDGNGMIIVAGPVGKMSTSVDNESDPEKMEAVVSFIHYHNQPESKRRLVINSGSIYATTAQFSESDSLESMLVELINYTNQVPFTINYFENGVGRGWNTGFGEETAKLWLGDTTPVEFLNNLERKTFQN